MSAATLKRIDGLLADLDRALLQRRHDYALSLVGAINSEFKLLADTRAATDTVIALPDQSQSCEG